VAAAGEELDGVCVCVCVCVCVAVSGAGRLHRRSLNRSIWLCVHAEKGIRIRPDQRRDRGRTPIRETFWPHAANPNDSPVRMDLVPRTKRTHAHACWLAAQGMARREDQHSHRIRGGVSRASPALDAPVPLSRGSAVHTNTAQVARLTVVRFAQDEAQFRAWVSRASWHQTQRCTTTRSH
jgi:hypothetical protein